MPQRMVLEGDNLEELRQYVYDELGPDARIVKAERILSGGVAGFFRSRSYEITVDVPDKATPGPKALGRQRRKQLDAAASKPEPTRDESFDSILTGVRDMAGTPEPSTAGELTVPAALPVVQTAAMKALADLGVPDRYLTPEGLAAFLTKLERPPELQRIAGSVIVVAGAGSSAQGTAHQIADKLSIGDVLHIGVDTELTTPNDVRTWRVHKRTTTVVCVHVGNEADDVRAASLLIAAANPMQVWAVVDARTKSADLRHWLSALGTNRRIDALAVRAVSETLQPGTVLDLGVPVGLLDGAPANRVAWAAVLADHLDDEATFG